ncbi:21116_t:CDS:1, partial [Gigaspora rosea]
MKKKKRESNSIEEVESLADDEPAVTENIEDKPNKVSLCAKYFLENLVQSEIKK